MTGAIVEQQYYC